MAAWSPEDIQILKDYAAAGVSRLRIAAKLKRSQSAVNAEARKHGIELKSSKQVRKENGLGLHWASNRDF